MAARTAGLKMRRLALGLFMALAALLALGSTASAVAGQSPSGHIFHPQVPPTYAYDAGLHSGRLPTGELASIAPDRAVDGVPDVALAPRGSLSLVSPFGVAANTGGWSLPPEGGALNIGGRWYTEHALERMAPNTPEVMAQLEARAMARAQAEGLPPGTREFGRWWADNGPKPRGIPPSVVEAEIANPGTTGVRAITNANGDVVTVWPTG